MKFCWQCSVDVRPGAAHSCAGNGKKIGLHPNSKLKGAYGTYEAVGLIGSGNLAVVIKGRDDKGRTVAIKQCLDPQHHSSFIKEAQALSSIPRGARIPHRIDYIEDNRLNEKYIIMEFISGENLYNLLIKKNRKFSPDEVLSIGYQVLETLGLMHDAGIIHRDIKPENLILETNSQLIYVVDFGGARSVQNPGMTQVMTPLYAPLELREGTLYYKPVKQSDFYCLAASLYECLVRQSLALDHHINGVQQSEINKLPYAWRPVFKKALEKDPKDRFQTAVEFQNALASLSNGKLKQKMIIGNANFQPQQPVNNQGIPKTVVMPPPPHVPQRPLNGRVQHQGVPLHHVSPPPAAWSGQQPVQQVAPARVRRAPQQQHQAHVQQQNFVVPARPLPAYVAPAPAAYQEPNPYALLEIVGVFGLVFVWSYFVYEVLQTGLTEQLVLVYGAPLAIVTFGFFLTAYFLGGRTLSRALVKGFANPFILVCIVLWLIAFGYTVFGR